MTESGAPAGTYVDSSVLVALFSLDDARRKVATAWLSRVGRDLATSVVAEIEIGRALRRRQVGAAQQAEADQLLASLERIELSPMVRTAARSVMPTALRTLDAIHVATALVAGLGRFASYDERQRMAAEEAGLTPVVP